MTAIPEVLTPEAATNVPPSSAPDEYRRLKGRQDHTRFLELLSRSDAEQNPVTRGINARALVEEVNERYNPDIPYTLTTMPQEVWDKLLMGGEITSIYIMGINTPSEAARLNSIRYLKDYKEDLGDPTLTEDQVVASPFALRDDELNPRIAKSWQEWDEFVERLHQKGVKVYIDYVPNHVALDHPWIHEHPDFFIEVSEEVGKGNADYYFAHTDSNHTVHYYARGKHYKGNGDPDPWTDTLQLDYRNPQLRQTMIERLRFLVHHADGVRVDTAILPDYNVFKYTWDIKYHVIPVTEPWDFWGEAIPAAKEEARKLGKDDFVFIGEAYENQDALRSFDIIYGFPFYGKLLDSRSPWGVQKIKEELHMLYNDPSPGHLLFLTNHDLHSSVVRFRGDAKRVAAAATITAFTPAQWMIHQGEEEVRINPPMQVTKPYTEPYSKETRDYMQAQYATLLRLRNSRFVQEGTASLIETGTPIIAQKFEFDGHGMVVCTNLNSDNQACRIELPQGIGKDDVEVCDLETGRKIVNATNPEGTEGVVHVLLSGLERQVVYYCTKQAATSKLPA